MIITLQQKPILAQKLIMTPQLQQAIKLLPLSRMELVWQIQKELGENPALEEVPEAREDKNVNDAIEWQNYIDSDNYHKKHSPGIDVKEPERIWVSNLEL